MTQARGIELVPHDTAAEEAVVAALLLDDEAIFRIIGTGLQPADFHDEYMGKLYGLCIAMAERGEPITLPTVAHEAREWIDRVGGEPALVRILGSHFTAIGSEAHARLVVRDASYRRMIQAGGEIARRGYEGGHDAAAAWQEAEAILAAAATRSATSDVLSIAHYIERELPEEDRVLYTTGYPALDRYVRGVAEGELVCVGARTDSGKTAIMVGMAYHQAQHGIPVAYVPLEGSVTQVMHRMASIPAHVSLGYARKNGWAEGEEDGYWAWYNGLHGLPVFFPSQDAIPGSIHAITSWITRAARQSGVKVAYVDHIDAVVLERERGQSTAGAYADAMKRLQELTRRERIAVVFASQVSREASRDNAVIPDISMLRESGSKEEASQTVIMLGLEDDTIGLLRPHRGALMHVRVAKVKDYVGEREVWMQGGYSPALFLDSRSGAVRQIGEAA